MKNSDAKCIPQKPVRSIEFYKGGVKLWGDRHVGNPTGKGRKQPRGEIIGWSMSSRRRMREFLLTKSGTEAFLPCGVTLTIPGPVPTITESKEAFEKFRLWLKNENHCAVWRVEAQKRGSLHWHLLLFVDTDRLWLKMNGDRKRDPDLESAMMLWSLKTYIRTAWFAAIDIMGACKGECTLKGKVGILEVKHRSAWFGAEEHSVDVSLDDGRGAWLRYLQDHTTKAKQEQIPENIGRHWGVINKKLFRTEIPESVFHLPIKKWCAFLRSYQRLCTSSCKAPEAPFGRRLRRRLKRGAVGGSVWFSRPSTVKRLADYYTSAADPVSP